MEDKQFTLRGLVCGLLGLVVITASSTYVALKLGALPWPTVFVTVVSLAALNLFSRKPSLQEVNVTHTLMSSGAMVAGGLAFTLPGFWINHPEGEAPLLSMAVLACSGALLGTLFSALYRKGLVERRALPFPIGRAAYDTLVAGSAGGKGAAVLFAAMAASIVFTVMRDALGWIPAVAILAPATALTAPLAVYVSPMALGIGAMIGPLYSLVWFGGAIAAYYALVPILVATGAFQDIAGANLFREGLGIGLMLGTGAGVALRTLCSKAAEILKKAKAGREGRSAGAGAAAGAGRREAWEAAALVAAVLVALVLLTEITLLQGILMVAGIALVTYLSATLTGQTGVNPMEIFGILVFLAISAFSRTTALGAFSIAAVTAVACGLTGDVANDFKSGSLLGTSPRAQIAAEAVGGLAGALVAVLALSALRKAFGFGPGTALPAPQASAVGAIAGGRVDRTALLIGAALGAALFFLKAPTATLGLGVYLPLHISTVMGLGAGVFLLLRRLLRSRESAERQIGLAASGLLGGEGMAGVAIALWMVARLGA